MPTQPAMARRTCVICTWRRHCIRGLMDDDPSDSGPSADECDSDSPAILAGLHTDPGPTWTSVINTSLLSHCSTPTPRGGRLWVRIPLRIPESNRQLDGSGNYWHFEGRMYSSNECVVAYHNCRVESLVTSTEVWGNWVGRGILLDGRLRYGYNSHAKNVGVNVYADGGLETFKREEPGWVQLEVECNSTTRLQSGRAHRYCIKGISGEVCRKARLCALWVLTEELPLIIRYG